MTDHYHTPEDVFRFVNVRPVQLAKANKRVVAFSHDAKEQSPIQADLEAVETRDEAEQIARDRLSAPDPGNRAGSLIEAARQAANAGTAAEAREVASTILGQSLGDFLESREAKELRNALWDQVYAHALVPDERPADRDQIVMGVQALHLLDEVTAGDDGAQPPDWDAASRLTPVVPASLFASVPSGGPRATVDKARAQRVMDTLGELADTVRAIDRSIADLRNTDRVVLARKSRRAQRERLDSGQPVRPDFPGRPALEAERTGENAGELVSGEIGEVAQQVLSVPRPLPWVFADGEREALRDSTLELIEARRDDLLEMDVPEIVAALESEKYDLVKDFVDHVPAELVPDVRQSEHYAAIVGSVPLPGVEYLEVAPLPILTRPKDPTSPSGRGIQPLGIGDLLVVQQELLRYAPGEVAHIENVLDSEHKNRTHTRERVTEETVVTEIEQMEESEKDLQTTERFELQKESEKTIESQMSLEAGLAISAGYGPVSVTAHADFALSESTSESNRTASTFARQVTERSISRIMQRSREERTRRTLERFEETNSHGFNNPAGNGHVIGVYRWVDKFYRARLVNYGRRLMIEFIVPEPASFYLHVLAGEGPNGVNLKKPEAPTASSKPLEPAHLTRSNYQEYVARYNVQDAEPCPAAMVQVGIAIAHASAAGAGNQLIGAITDKLNVPKGYQFVDTFGDLWMMSTGPGLVHCVIAGRPWGVVQSPGLEGTVPVSLTGIALGYSLNIIANCRLKEEAMQAWQLKTYAAIMSAYERELADYNEQLAAAMMQAEVQIDGRNPELNRKIERDELTKGALRLLTNDFTRTRVGGTWRFNELFDAMGNNGQYGYPEFDTDEAMVEGRIIQFFEQAFEWSNLTYRFYPYHWGRKSEWKDAFPRTDPDPLFTDFLRAGAARVIVPVHPSYNEVVLHYLATNEIWNGGKPPVLNDPLYISIAEELKADAIPDMDEAIPACSPNSEYPCIADEWEVKLPTTLVYLQQDASLPGEAAPA